MAIITQEEALERADQIRDETGEKDNTAERVGQLLHDAFETFFATSGSVPPLPPVFIVHGETAVDAELQDGGPGSPYSTIQAGVDDHPELDFLTFLVVPPSSGNQVEDISIDRLNGPKLTLVSYAPHAPAFGTPLVIEGDISLTGSEGPGYLTLQDIDVDGDTLATTFLGLIRSRTIDTTSVAATGVRLLDGESSVSVLAAPTNVAIREISNIEAFSEASSVTAHNPFPANYKFSGSHEFTLYLSIVTPATTGTLDLTAEWDDGNGSRSLKIIDALDVTSGGPGLASVALPLKLSDTAVTFTVALAGVDALSYGVQSGLRSVGTVG